MLRQDNSAEAERLLGHMDDIYSILVTMDYRMPLQWLRRQTDIIRAIIERTRGDVPSACVVKNWSAQCPFERTLARFETAGKAPSRFHQSRIKVECPATATAIA